MTVNDWVRFLGGFMVLVGIALSYFVNPWWLLLSLFVALNLMQSAFSRWCPAMSFLKKLGVRS